MTTRNKEHVKDECWCGHSAEKHRWDAARDLREYECLGCREAALASPRPADPEVIERIRRRHPLYYETDGRLFARCPECEQWSPCDVRVVTDAYAAEHAAPPPEAERERYKALIPVLKRAKGIIDNGAEMVGPEPYSFTKDEVIGVAAEAIEAALKAIEEAIPSDAEEAQNAR